MSNSLWSYGLCSLSGSSIQRILQARILDFVAMPSSRGSSWPRDQTHISLCLLHWQKVTLLLAPAGKPYICWVSKTTLSIRNMGHVALIDWKPQWSYLQTRVTSCKKWPLVLWWVPNIKGARYLRSKKKELLILSILLSAEWKLPLMKCDSTLLLLLHLFLLPSDISLFSLVIFSTFFFFFFFPLVYFPFFFINP